MNFVWLCARFGTGCDVFDRCAASAVRNSACGTRNPKFTGPLPHLALLAHLAHRALGRGLSTGFGHRGPGSRYGECHLTACEFRETRAENEVEIVSSRRSSAGLSLDEGTRRFRIRERRAERGEMIYIPSMGPLSRSWSGPTASTWVTAQHAASDPAAESAWPHHMAPTRVGTCPHPAADNLRENQTVRARAPFLGSLGQSR